MTRENGASRAKRNPRAAHRKRKRKKLTLDDATARGRVQMRQTKDETAIQAEASGLPPRDMVLVVALVVVLLVALVSVAFAHK